MEIIEVILSKASRQRLDRIKYLRRADVGVILADQEIMIAALSAYWLMCEKRAANSTDPVYKSMVERKGNEKTNSDNDSGN